MYYKVIKKGSVIFHKDTCHSVQDVTNLQISRHSRDDRVDGSLISIKVLPKNWASSCLRVLLVPYSTHWGNQLNFQCRKQSVSVSVNIVVSTPVFTNPLTGCPSRKTVIIGSEGRWAASKTSLGLHGLLLLAGPRSALSGVERNLSLLRLRMAVLGPVKALIASWAPSFWFGPYAISS